MGVDFVSCGVGVAFGGGRSADARFGGAGVGLTSAGVASFCSALMGGIAGGSAGATCCSYHKTKSTNSSTGSWMPQ